MALKAVALSLDEVEEALRGYYTAQKIKDKDGKDIEAHVLEIDGLDDGVVVPHPVVRNLRNAHERTKKDRSTMSARLAELETRVKDLPEDFQPDEYTRLKALEADFEANKDKNKDQKIELDNMRRMYEERMRKQAEDHAKVVEKLQRDGTAKDQTIQNLVRKHDLDAALTNVGIKTEDRDVVTAYHMPRMTVEVGDDGTIRTFIDGAPTGEFMTAWANSDRGRRYVEPLRGSDARAGGGGAVGGENPWAEKQWNLTKQQDVLRANPNRAKQLMSAAGFETQEQAIAAGANRRMNLRSAAPPPVLTPQPPFPPQQ